jgi:hypothetical protein
MNIPQRIVLVIGAIAIAVMVLFPPYTVVYLEGLDRDAQRVTRFAGYRPLWQSPSGQRSHGYIFLSAQLDTNKLYVQLVGAATITVLLWAVLKSRSREN